MNKLVELSRENVGIVGADNSKLVDQLLVLCRETGSGLDHSTDFYLFGKCAEDLASAGEIDLAAVFELRESNSHARDINKKIERLISLLSYEATLFGVDRVRIRERMEHVANRLFTLVRFSPVLGGYTVSDRRKYDFFRNEIVFTPPKEDSARKIVRFCLTGSGFREIYLEHGESYLF